MPFRMNPPIEEWVKQVHQMRVEKADKMLAAVAEDFVELAKTEAPVITGNLRDSIRVVPFTRRTGHVVRAHAEYAKFVEEGYVTRKGNQVMPNAFMWRAMHQVELRRE